jgi:hypothetical protein
MVLAGWVVDTIQLVVVGIGQGNTPIKDAAITGMRPEPYMDMWYRRVVNQSANGRSTGYPFSDSEARQRNPKMAQRHAELVPVSILTDLENMKIIHWSTLVAAQAQD